MSFICNGVTLWVCTSPVPDHLTPACSEQLGSYSSWKGNQICPIYRAPSKPLSSNLLSGCCLTWLPAGLVYPVFSTVDWIACSVPWKSKQTNEPQNEPKQPVQPNSFPSGPFYMGPEFRQLVFYLNHVYLYKYEKLSSLCPQSNCLGLSPNYLNTFSKQDIKTEN